MTIDSNDNIYVTSSDEIYVTSSYEKIKDLIGSNFVTDGFYMSDRNGSAPKYDTTVQRHQQNRGRYGFNRKNTRRKVYFAA